VLQHCSLGDRKGIGSVKNNLVLAIPKDSITYPAEPGVISEKRPVKQKKMTIAVLVSSSMAQSLTKLWTLTIVGTHSVHPRRYGQAELAQVADYITREFTCTKAATHPTTN